MLQGVWLFHVPVQRPQRSDFEREQPLQASDTCNHALTLAPFTSDRRDSRATAPLPLVGAISSSSCRCASLSFTLRLPTDRTPRVLVLHKSFPVPAFGISSDDNFSTDASEKRIKMLWLQTICRD
ncbi:hypothetical protein GRJ2_001941000 [Grus japonensis]|uniref:Uncharacterized protein n=1 Tax=Grus japonensis TaxID=30415 RepID=A0ABC9XDG2_GRUJA